MPSATRYDVCLGLIGLRVVSLRGALLSWPPRTGIDLLHCALYVRGSRFHCRMLVSVMRSLLNQNYRAGIVPSPLYEYNMLVHECNTHCVVSVLSPALLTSAFLLSAHTHLQVITGSPASYKTASGENNIEAREIYNYVTSGVNASLLENGGGRALCLLCMRSVILRANWACASAV
jgi:hypothetical protein